MLRIRVGTTDCGSLYAVFWDAVLLFFNNSPIIISFDALFKGKHVRCPVDFRDI